MKNKSTTIKLKFDVSTIVFEKIEQTTKTNVGFAGTHSFAQSNNYPFFIMDFFSQTKAISKKKSSFKKRDEILLFEKVIVPFNEPPFLFEPPFEIKLIATAPFFHVCKQKR